MSRNVDIAVIGAGIAGASLAWRMKDSADVLLIEREDRAGFHATGRSTFTFVESYGSPLVRRLTSASRRFYETPPEGFTDTPLFSPRGNVKLARPEDKPALTALFNDARSHVDNLHEISVSEAVSLCPLLNANLFSAAFYEPDAMDMDVNAIHSGFLKGSPVLLRSSVTSLTHAGGKWSIKLTDGEQITASILVNAAGAWASEIGRMARARDLPLKPRRRSVFTFVPDVNEPFDHWPLVRDVPETFYFKPSAGALLATPANQTPSLPCDAQPEELDIAIGIDRLEKATGLKPKHLASKWAGLRTFSADENPVIGFDDKAPNFFWLAGQGGYGIQTAPALSQIAADFLKREQEKTFSDQWINDLSPLRALKI